MATPGERDSGLSEMEIDQSEAPPPIPPAEMPREKLAEIVEAGDVRAVEAALREQNVRLPDVLDELERVLGKGFGNLAAAMTTMLISSFHIARADKLAERVLLEKDSAGSDELADLAAALLVSERLTISTRVLDAVLTREPSHARSLYLRARVYARKGAIERAFETIARVSPKDLGPAGMAVQARYALLAGRGKALEGALKHARKSDDPGVLNQVIEIERIHERVKRAPQSLVERAKHDLRSAMALEYGTVLVERAQDAADGGRFDMEVMNVRDVGRLIEKIAALITQLGAPVKEWIFANEDGEIVAAALAKQTSKPYREWRADMPATEGAWLCMASAATHPHMPNAVVRTLQTALDEGVLRTIALVLPAGWRGPLVPDIIGRMTGDDELPWAIDDEVDDVVAEMFDDSEAPTSGLVRDDRADLDQHVIEARTVLRLLENVPRGGHVPFLDETPIPRA